LHDNALIKFPQEKQTLFNQCVIFCRPHSAHALRSYADAISKFLHRITITQTSIATASLQNPSKPLSGLRVSVVSKKTRITISKTRKGHHRLTMVTLQDERRVVWRWRMAARLFNFYQII
jgi:hypothetical protein